MGAVFPPRDEIFLGDVKGNITIISERTLAMKK